jgi:hypothetical protein
LQAFYSSPSLPTDDSWYLNTGATHHLTSDLHNFNLTSDAYTGSNQIHVGNGTCLSINHIGYALISSSRRSFILNQLLHVPSICKNLFSVRQFAHDNSIFFEFHSTFFAFHSTFFVIKGCHTRSILHQGPLRSGLYQLLPYCDPSPSRYSLVGEMTSASHWHKRLGHPGLRTIKHVILKFSLPVFSNKKVVACASCQQPKGHQLPFTASTYVTLVIPLELPFSDVSSPSPMVSSTGNKYYVSFIDAF